MDVILIFPPVAKPSEPPAGIAKLCGALSQHGISHKTLDANLEGLHTLLMTPHPPTDTWTHRATRHRARHLASLTSWEAYQDGSRYRRAIKDLTHLLEMTGRLSRTRLGFANYEHEDLLPVRSGDLMKAAENPEINPFHPYFERRLKALLEDEKPSMIGFSLNYLSQALCTFAMIGFIKQNFPGIMLVLGGGLVTSWVRKPQWKNPFEGLVDRLVAGPGEGLLLSLMGVGVQTGSDKGNLKHCHFRPEYDSFALKSYFAPGPILPYSASSGCYWNRCSFCPERAERNPYVPIPPDQVMDDLSYLVDQQQPVLIHFLDNAISPSLMKAISKHPPGVPWYGFARLTRDLTDLDYCNAVKRSGCMMLKIGLESGDQTVLDSMQKGIRLAEASSALKNLKKAGIATYVYLLFGTPEESLSEARRTLDFVVSHRDCITFLNLALFNMPIYGAEAEQMGTEAFYEGDLSLYTSFDHPKAWSRPKVRQFLDKEFKRHPAVMPILRRDPPVFTSNHAPFFTPHVAKHLDPAVNR